MIAKYELSPEEVEILLIDHFKAKGIEVQKVNFEVEELCDYTDKCYGYKLGKVVLTAVVPKGC